MSTDALADTTVSFNATDIAKSSERPKYKDGWYRLRCVKGQRHVNTKMDSKGVGNMGVVQTFAAVDDNDDTVEPKGIRNWLTFPKETPPDILEKAGLPEDVRQKKMPNTLGIIQGYLRATRSDDFPTYPKPSDEEEGMFVFRGELITKEERQEKREELNDNIGKFLASLWSDPSQLEGDEVVALVEKTAKGYLNIKKITDELPEGEEFVDLDNPYAEEDDES